MPALAVHDLAKQFGEVAALRDVTFSVGEGERLALLGPNGAGKTTLVRCICGRVAPDRGSIELRGRKLPTRGRRNELGFVPQELAIYPDLTTEENLFAFGRFHGLRGRKLRERVRWALEWTGLAERAGSLTRTFSGGMKRRVNIACGVLHAPRVLLLDEPTVGVDPQSRERIFQMLDHLRDSGASIVLTTHHLEEAEQRCDRIVIIDHGQVAASGTLGELIAQTIGPQRRVRLTLNNPLERVNGYALTEGRRALETKMDDVATELPQLIAEVDQAGGRIADIQLNAPTLHAVFLHLTGKELRE